VLTGTEGQAQGLIPSSTFRRGSNLSGREMLPGPDWPGGDQSQSVALPDRPTRRLQGGVVEGLTKQGRCGRVHAQGVVGSRRRKESRRGVGPVLGVIFEPLRQVHDRMRALFGASSMCWH